MSKEKKFCPKCGKTMNLVAAGWYCMKDDFLIDMVTGKLVGAPKETIEYTATYLGGHPGYLDKTKCRMIVDDVSLKIPEMDFEIDYKEVLGVRITSKRVGDQAANVLLAGIWRLLVNVEKEFMLLEMNDELGNRVGLAFIDVYPSLGGAVRRIYRQAVAARKTSRSIDK